MPSRYSNYETERKEFVLSDIGGGWTVAAYTFHDGIALLSGGEPERRIPLIRANAERDVVEFAPCRTLHGHGFLSQKYKRIRTIALEGLGFGSPATSGDVFAMLESLPTGFIKDPEFGLGLLKDYRFIIEAIEAIPGVTKLVISATRSTEIGEGEYVLSLTDFSTIRRSIDRTHLNALKEARTDKDVLARNALLHVIAPDKFEEAVRPYKPDTVFKAVAGISPSRLSEGDRLAAVEAVARNRRELAAKHPKRLLELKRDIELVTLEQLIKKVEDWLGKSLDEGKWQSLFADNPFILSLAFGFPVTIVQGQVTVGGRTFSGAGDKIADFLYRNQLTDNLSLIEIKKPETVLLGSPYRGGVHPPSRDLSGSITQVLDQRFRLQAEMSSLLRNSRRSDLEAYAVRCLVIVGRSPGQVDEKRSFELFRNSLHDVLVLTFDELLEKLRGLHEFLSGSGFVQDDLERVKEVEG